MPSLHIYGEELNRSEGETIEELKAVSQQPIPDSDEWLEKELRRNILVTTVDMALGWSRRASLWPVLCFPACCAFEFVTTAASRLRG